MPAWFWTRHLPRSPQFPARGSQDPSWWRFLIIWTDSKFALENRPSHPPKRNNRISNHPFTGAMLASERVNDSRIFLNCLHLVWKINENSYSFLVTKHNLGFCKGNPCCCCCCCCWLFARQVVRLQKKPPWVFDAEDMCQISPPGACHHPRNSANMRINVTKTQFVLHRFCPEASVTQKNVMEDLDYLVVSINLKYITLGSCPWFYG